MARLIIAIVILLTNTIITLAADKKETGYESINPFDIAADSYEYTVQKLYESLPLVSNLKDIPGTIDLANAAAQEILAGDLSVTTQKPKPQSWNFYNLLPIGERKIEVRKLDADNYFWLIYGKIQFQRKRHYYPNDPLIKTIANYFIVLHFKKGNAQFYTDYYTINGFLIKINRQTLDKISKEATILRQKYNENAYNDIQKKTTWMIGDKTEDGTFDGYKNGKVTLKKEGKSNRVIDTKKFSYEEQLLIRGYLDHQGIPIR